MDSFFLTLPSNSSPQNTQASFVTELSQPFELQGRWEVGLAEVHLCQTWYNITETNNYFYAEVERVNKKTQKNSPKTYETVEGDIPVGRYTSVEMLLKQIQKTFSTLANGNPLHLHHNIDGTVTIESPVLLKFSDGLREILGFTSPAYMKGKQRGKYPVELSAGVYGLYLYCDLIEPYCVGTGHAPLLRVLPVNPSKSGGLTVYNYDSPDYFPLARNSFDRVEIYLKTDTGKSIVFPSGKTLVKLHFRRRNEKAVHSNQL